MLLLLLRIIFIVLGIVNVVEANNKVSKILWAITTVGWIIVVALSFV